MRARKIQANCKKRPKKWSQIRMVPKMNVCRYAWVFSILWKISNWQVQNSNWSFVERSLPYQKQLTFIEASFVWKHGIAFDHWKQEDNFSYNGEGKKEKKRAKSGYFAGIQNKFKNSVRLFFSFFFCPDKIKPKKSFFIIKPFLSKQICSHSKRILSFELHHLHHLTEMQTHTFPCHLSK